MSNKFNPDWMRRYVNYIGYGLREEDEMDTMEIAKENQEVIAEQQKEIEKLRAEIAAFTLDERRE